MVSFMTMRRLKLFLAAVLAIFSICCSFNESKKIGERGVSEFHSRLNAENYNEIYSQADKEFRKTESEQTIITFLRTVHEKLGQVKETKVVGFRVHTEAGVGTFVAISCSTQFTNGTAHEQFQFRIDNNLALLMRYDISSPNLVIE
jgi:hypothetical protein